MTSDGIGIRAMHAGDAAGVAALCRELGYEANPVDVTRRLTRLNGHPDHALFVAIDDGPVVGWAHVCGVARLQSDGYAEIGGIVVAASQRRRGIGRHLMRVCEHWAGTAGYTRLRLRSGLQRDAAHQFYQSIGYAQQRTSHAFERTLADGAAPDSPNLEAVRP